MTSLDSPANHVAKFENKIPDDLNIPADEDEGKKGRDSERERERKEGRVEEVFTGEGVKRSLKCRTGNTSLDVLQVCFPAAFGRVVESEAPDS